MCLITKEAVLALWFSTLDVKVGEYYLSDEARFGIGSRAAIAHLDKNSLPILTFRRD